MFLRNVSCDDHVINDKIRSLRDNGFINYFGMQRFGTSSVPTYHIGRYVYLTQNSTYYHIHVHVTRELNKTNTRAANTLNLIYEKYFHGFIKFVNRRILHSDWRGAVDAILMPRPGGMSYIYLLNLQTFLTSHLVISSSFSMHFNKCHFVPSVGTYMFVFTSTEEEGLTSAREYFMKTRDAGGTLRILPRRRPLEKTLLEGLVKRGPNDYLGALKCVSCQALEVEANLHPSLSLCVCPDSIQFTTDVCT